MYNIFNPPSTPSESEVQRVHSFVQWFNGEICHRHFFFFCISIIVLCNRTFTVLLSNLLLWLFSSIFFSSLSNRFLRVLVYYYCNSILSFHLFSFTFLHLHNSTQFFSYYGLIFSNIPISFSSYHVSFFLLSSSMTQIPFPSTSSSISFSPLFLCFRLFSSQ